MDSITLYLNKYRNLDVVDGDIVKYFQDIFMEKITGAKEKPHASVKNGVIFVSVSGALRSELLLKKESIQNELEERIGKKRKVL